MEQETDYAEKNYVKFGELLTNATSISSTYDGLPVRYGGEWASFIYARFIQNCHSIQLLLPTKDGQLASNEFAADHFSIASITRTSIDASIMIMYLTCPDLSQQEWKIRKAIIDLHDATNRYRMFKSGMRSLSNADTVDDIDQSISEYTSIREYLTERIRENPAFEKFDESEKNRILSGQAVFVRGVRGAVREAGWDVDGYEFTNSYLSAFIHSHPISFHRAHTHGIDFKTTKAAQMALIGLCLENLVFQLAELNSRMLDYREVQKESFLTG